jgi:hypothetical protein
MHSLRSGAVSTSRALIRSRFVAQALLERFGPRSLQRWLANALIVKRSRAVA